MDLGTIDWIKENWPAIQANPWTFAGVFLIGLLLAVAVEEWRHRDDGQQIRRLKEQLEETKALAASPGRRWNRARFRDYSNDTDIPARMRMNQWALLLRGYEPDCEVDDAPAKMAPGVYRVFKVMKEAVNAKRLKTITGNTHYSSEIDREELRRFYKAEGRSPLWLFPGPMRLLKLWRI